MYDKLTIELVSTRPFVYNNSKVIDLIQKILAVLEPYDEYMDCQEAWAHPRLHPQKMVKYNNAAMNLISEKVSSEETIVYGVRDWDFVSKGNHGKQAYVNIGVGCQQTNGSHEFGYRTSLVFHPETARILLDNGLVSIIGELVQAVSADYGCMDFHRFCSAGMMAADLIRLAGINLKSEPDEYNLTGLLPCLSWWTLLNKQHIAALGGKEAILEQAPCYAVHDLSTDQYEAMALQLTAEPEGMKKRDYTMLRNYLKPVIPPTNKYALTLLLKSRKIPLSRLKWNVSAEEIAEAEALTSLSSAELREKAAESV